MNTKTGPFRTKQILLLIAAGAFACAAAAEDCSCPSGTPAAAEPFSMQQAERTLLLGYLEQGEFDKALTLLERSVWREDAFHQTLRSLLVRYQTFQEDWRQREQQAQKKLHDTLQTLCSDPNQVSAHPEEILSLLVRTRPDQIGTTGFLSDPFVLSLTEQIRRNIRDWQTQGEYEKAWQNGLRVLLAADPNNPALQEEKAQLLSKLSIVRKLARPLCPNQSEADNDTSAETLLEALRRLDAKYMHPLNYPALSRRLLTCAQHIGEVLACGRKDLRYSADPNAQAAWNEHLLALQEAADGSAFLEQIRRLLERNRTTLQLPEGFLIQLLAAGVLEELDPYTEIVWPSRNEEFDKQMNGEFAGVGIRISRKDNHLEIVEIVPGTPAEESGQLQIGDSITAIDGTPTDNLSLDCAVRLISGPAGTSVALSIRREAEEKTVTLFRRKITLPSLHGNASPLEQPLNTDGDFRAYQIDSDPGIAYIRLSSFRKDTAQTLRQILETLRAGGLRGLILDLRSNTGGLLDVAAVVADLFLDSGTLVKACLRDGTGPEIKASEETVLPPAIPMIVLVDENTASGAEIVAGSLAFSRPPRAVLVGTRTYGKGTIQEVESLPGGSRLKYTRGFYQLADGRTVPNRFERLKQNRTDWGLEPHVLIETSASQTEPIRQVRQKLETFFKENKNRSPAESREELLNLLESLVRSDPPLAAGLTILKAKLLASELPPALPAAPDTPHPSNAENDPNR